MESISSSSGFIKSFQGHGDGVDAIAKTNRAGRRDGRTHNEMRTVEVTHETLRHADGSARLKVGGTDVLVAVYGPLDGPLQRQDPEQVHIHVTFRRRVELNVSDSTNMTEDAIIIKNIRCLIQDCLLAHLFPRKALIIAVQVLSNHGSLIATAFNATLLALLNAAVPMKQLPVAACVATHTRDLTVDPLLIEEREADSVITAVFDVNETDTHLGNYLQNNRNSFLSVCTQGCFQDQKVFSTALHTCRQLAIKTRAFVTKSLEQKAARKFVWNTTFE